MAANFDTKVGCWYFCPDRCCFCAYWNCPSVNFRLCTFSSFLNNPHYVNQHYHHHYYYCNCNNHHYHDYPMTGQHIFISSFLLTNVLSEIVKLFRFFFKYIMRKKFGYSIDIPPLSKHIMQSLTLSRFYLFIPLFCLI